MTDRPIPFSKTMILALLDGSKTQTRWVLKDAPEGEWFVDPNPRGEGLAWVAPEGAPSIPIRTPYHVGDRLWVREAWRCLNGLDPLSGSQIARQCVEEAGYGKPWAPIQYEVDGERDNWICDPHSFGVKPGRYRHARFMPRWASRLTLTVTDVRVQRVQEVSEEDARAEGALIGDHSVYAFSQIWNGIHGPGAWDKNPWVCALTFDVHRCNIDQMGAPNDR